MRKRDAAIGAQVNANALDLADVRPGDIGVAHSRGLIGWLIRLGTRSHWNHSFVVVEVGDHTPDTVTVVQAEAHGVEYAKLSEVAPGGSWAILRCPLGTDPDMVVEQAHGFVGWDYAFIVIGSLVVNIILPFLRLQVQRSGTLICSAVSALSLHAGGYLDASWTDLYAVTPAQIAIALSAPDA